MKRRLFRAVLLTAYPVALLANIDNQRSVAGLMVVFFLLYIEAAGVER